MTDTIETTYTERFTQFIGEGQSFKNVTKEHKIQTSKAVPTNLGLMIVGFGGNNGSTLTAAIMAHQKDLKWDTKNGEKKPNFYGSFTQSATCRVGVKYNENMGTLEDVHMPVKDILPMVNPTNFNISGWDISGTNIYDACKRAKVLEPDLYKQMKADLSALKPLQAVLNPDYIAANQEDRADNVFKGTNRECIDKIRKDIQEQKKACDKVIVLWSANTEMFFLPEIQSQDELLAKVKDNVPLPGSVLYCIAAIEEGVTYLNGSPQNTFHPGMVQYADTHNACLGGSDFKSGQTRFKTIMSDFLIGAGLKLSSVVSYNHLGNNDGKNLQEDKCFQSKKISKAGVIDDAMASNDILYPKGEKKIDHDVIIRYVPFVGDSKRAMDEYSSEIFMGGINTISTYNICEDSLLATPIMIDMVVLAELFSRMKIDGEKLGPVLSYLSFFFKAPITNHNEYVINSFSR